MVNTLSLPCFYKKYSRVGDFVGWSFPYWELLWNLLSYVRDGVCGACFVFVLQLSGFVIASGVEMLATHDALQSTLLPGRATNWPEKDFSVWVLPLEIFRRRRYSWLKPSGRWCYFACPVTPNYFVSFALNTIGQQLSCCPVLVLQYSWVHTLKSGCSWVYLKGYFEKEKKCRGPQRFFL